MKIKHRLMYLRNEVFKGKSGKTGNDFEIKTVYFLDEDMKEQAIGIPRNVELDVSVMKPMQMYDVILDIETGKYTNVNMTEFFQVDMKKATA